MSDLCYSRPMLDHVLAQAELMDRMIDCVGVNPAVIARLDRGMTWYAARTRCIECSHSRECQAWVAASARGAAPPDFCPNAALFQSCQSNVLEDRAVAANKLKDRGDMPSVRARSLQDG